MVHHLDLTITFNPICSGVRKAKGLLLVEGGGGGELICYLCVMYIMYYDHLVLVYLFVKLVCYGYCPIRKGLLMRQCEEMVGWRGRSREGIVPNPSK